MTNSRRMKKKRHKTQAADLLSKGYCHDESLNISTQSCNGVISTTLDFGREYLPSTNINASLRFPEYGSSKLNLKFQQSFRNAALSIFVGLNQSPDILLSAAIATSSIACGIESKYKTASHCFTRAEKRDLLRLAYTHHFGRSRKIPPL
ncbi:hypothetical protein Gorai_002364 [Gossypium raimondii]|uniref:Uncharacterized protein n=1 Tax=Gossypium raimondii TaxID=29730 RepID=A0A7J8QKS0_GOSRA|nr:hypothetical protein [Gossypium raimondii]